MAAPRHANVLEAAGERAAALRQQRERGRGCGRQDGAGEGFRRGRWGPRDALPFRPGPAAPGQGRGWGLAGVEEGPRHPERARLRAGGRDRCYLEMSPFLRMTWRCQGASLVSS